MVELKDITSSQVARLGYDTASRTLAVIYRGGGATVYHYRDVPPEVGAAVLEAESVGRALNQMVRGKFDFEAHALDDERAAVDSEGGATD